MKITAIEAQVKHRGRYSIFVDEKFVFGLSELGLIHSGLRIGQEVSDDELKRLKDDAATDRLYNKVLYLIARRPRSRWEITEYLKRNSKNTEEIAKILQILEEKNFINDTDFARRWVENRRLLKNTSRRKLALELKQKRINDEIIQQVLSEDETSDQDVLKDEIAKKRRQTRYQDDQKLIAYLARQGYGYADIKQALGEGPDLN